ncbi:MAG TPA: adenosylmethionine decarboxylase, partial [Micavibrio sp.]
EALRKSAEACGATVLDITLHSFGEGAGITGVAVLSESHISIHTWPEIGFAALDVFMCGTCDPRKAVPVLQEFFKPGETVVSECRRGDKK